jgi:hypothetical protein
MIRVFAVIHAVPPRARQRSTTKKSHYAMMAMSMPRLVEVIDTAKQKFDNLQTQSQKIDVRQIPANERSVLIEWIDVMTKLTDLFAQTRPFADTLRDIQRELDVDPTGAKAQKSENWEERMEAYRQLSKIAEEIGPTLDALARLHDQLSVHGSRRLGAEEDTRMEQSVPEVYFILNTPGPGVSDENKTLMNDMARRVQEYVMATHTVDKVLDVLYSKEGQTPQTIVKMRDFRKGIPDIKKILEANKEMFDLLHDAIAMELEMEQPFSRHLKRMMTMAGQALAPVIKFGQRGRDILALVEGEQEQKKKMMEMAMGGDKSWGG